MSKKGRELKRRLKALEELKASLRETIGKYSLLYKSAHEETLEIQEKLKKLEEKK